MKPEELLKSIQKKFGKKVKGVKIERKAYGKKKKESVNVWIGVERDIFKKVIKYLCEIHPHPHHVVSSGNDLGKNLELIHLAKSRKIKKF